MYIHIHIFICMYVYICNPQLTLFFEDMDPPTQKKGETFNRKEESFDVGYWNPPCERSPMSPIPNVLEVPPFFAVLKKLWNNIPQVSCHHTLEVLKSPSLKS